MSVRLSVQIVTWNSAAVLDECLASLLAQTCRDFEVLVVDNGSRDDSARRTADWLERGLRGRLVAQPDNRGFCQGQNAAFALSTGDWVLFLNPDARLPADFVAQALRFADAQPADVGTLAPLLLLPDGRIDSSGLQLDRFRRVYDRGYGEDDDGRFAQEEDVLGCTGAAALHRRAMLSDVAVDGRPLDESLFAYYDDLDLSWRARLRGWRCRFVPQLRAVHARAGRNALRGLAGRRTRGAEQALTVRNRFLVLAKCESAAALVWALPWLLPFELARLVFLIWRAPLALRGYAGALRALPEALRQRRRIRARLASRRAG